MKSWSQDVTQIAQRGERNKTQDVILKMQVFQRLTDSDVSMPIERDMREESLK